jgi:hypothetical protein
MTPRIVAAVACIAVLIATPVASAQSTASSGASEPAVTIGGPIPPAVERHYDYRTRSHVALQAAGASVVAAFYAMALVPAFSATLGNAIPSDRYLFIPVAGPFVVAADLNVNSSDRVWLLLDGALQLTGAAVVVAGSLIRRRHVAGILEARAAPTLLPFAAATLAGVSLRWDF